MRAGIAAGQVQGEDLPLLRQVGGQLRGGDTAMRAELKDARGLAFPGEHSQGQRLHQGDRKSHGGKSPHLAVYRRLAVSGQQIHQGDHRDGQNVRARIHQALRDRQTDAGHFPQPAGIYDSHFKNATKQQRRFGKRVSFHLIVLSALDSMERVSIIQQKSVVSAWRK